ncbi:hypothetical protein [Paraburkholderia sp. 2C]
MSIRIGWTTRACIQAWVLCVAAIVFPPTMADGRDVCPNPLTGGGHNSGGYVFEYQSWSWVSPEPNHGRSYCHCVRNNTPKRALFINWSEVGLSTIIPPDQVAYAYFTSSEGSPIHRAVPLWYGAVPDKVDVQTVFNSQAGQTADSMQPGASGLASASASADAPHALSSNDELETEVAAFLPDLERVAHTVSKDPTYLTREQIMRSVEDNAEFLVSFAMKFSSDPKIDTQSGALIAVRNACDYQFGKISADKQSVYFAMRIRDPELHRMVFRTSEAMPLRNWPGKRQSFEGSEDLQKHPGSTLTLSTSTLEIVAIGSDTVLASVDIRYYSVEPIAPDKPLAMSPAPSE